MPAPKPLPPPLDAPLDPLPQGSGPAITTRQLIATGPAVVFAIRRVGCGLCREGIKEAQERIDEIKAAGASRVVAVVKEDIGTEVGDFRAFWTGDMFLDRELQFYKALGGGQIWKPFGGVFSFMAMLLNPFSTRRTKENIKKTTTKGNFKGEGFGAGGVYVIRRDGSAAYSFLEEELGDHPSVNDLIAALVEAAKAERAAAPGS